MRRSKALVLAALAAAAGAGSTPAPITQASVQAGSQSDKQAPAQAPVAAADLQFLADAGARITRLNDAGIPWPGYTAARARRSAGAWR